MELELMKSFVYVISGDHGRQKIGSSDDPVQRIRSLQTGSPFPLKFEFVGEVENGAGGQVEVAAQYSLNTHKAAGGDEWFVVPPDVAIAAVIAAGHRLGFRVRPVDPDGVAANSYAIGMPTWHKVVTAILAVPFLLAAAWLIYSFDQGQIGGVAAAGGVAVLVGLFKLARMAAIQIGNGFIAVDRAMHPES
ncbi:GIY-YIG nuclease family protein [Bradyrhizobium sp. SZCCHNRI1002]|uniref:GIY-YIG nuclease family protein n=1 Tax=Bradyrhizobium sp. SZCCHNRI1002 TaxID=3057274 RepID=UPI0028E32836|nr:GIY-YIG nuclease family protein [Bradyrhizobium sp. SZCCHNRI1002]